ncbi:jumping translocation breakpoint, isoform CRA_a [Rattus norvegicus]|uniref:Jumping translocation breakpoint, isoform CRA_a n=1 Tax=Rattus norvegicus TaxID=10116 RepID=A6J6L1_RAT|nr:jumping translocation breakpoint, isoform CRA_a [Rattus norvegicus]
MGRAFERNVFLNGLRLAVFLSLLLVSTSTSPCWLVEEFVVTEECTPCSNFQILPFSSSGTTLILEV